MNARRLTVAAFALMITLSFAGHASAITVNVGNTVIDRANHDGANGSIFAMLDVLPTDGQISTWAFFDNNFSGRQITPLLLERVGTSTFIRGIGTTRTSDASGTQSFPFGLVSGSDMLEANYQLGWKDGSNGANNAGTPEWTNGGDDFGVRWFNAGHTVFAVNDNLGGGSGDFNREYSIRATYDNVTDVTAVNMNVSSTLDISMNGQLVAAFNAQATNTVTVAGIDFVGTGPGFPLGQGFTGANPLNATGNAAFDELLNSASFQNGASGLTLGGLEVGKTYEVQMFLVDNRTCCNTRTVRIDAGDASILTPPIGTVQSVLLTFQANTASLDIAVVGVSGGVGYLSGFQVRDVTPIPEPATAALLSAAGFALIRRGRRAASRIA